MDKKLSYLVDENSITHKVTHLDSNGLAICQTYWQYGQELFSQIDILGEQEFVEQVNSIVENLMVKIESIYPSSYCKVCQPTLKKPKCRKCQLCTPSCDPKKKNPNCFKCKPELLIFDNEDRLVVNKNKICNLTKNYSPDKTKLMDPKLCP